MKTLRWFKDMVGKRIYRDKDTCKCQGCEDVFQNGLVVRNECHADYLYNIQNDFANEGTFLNYRDKKKKNPLQLKK